MTTLPRIPRPRGLWRNRRGTAFTEFAIVLPMIVLLLFGLLEMGLALLQQHTLTQSVRDAARYLARVPLECPATGDADWATAVGNAQNLALTGQLSGGQPLVTNWSAADFTVADPVCQSWSGRQVQVMSVTGDVAYQDLGLLGVIGLPALRLAAQHQQVHIGE